MTKENGLEKELDSLLHETVARAKVDAEKLIAEAEQKRKEQLEGLDREYAQKRISVEKDLELLMKNELAEKLATAELEAKRITNTAKEKAVMSAVASIVDFMREQRGKKLKDKYSKYLMGSIESARAELGEGIKIRAGEVEYSLLKGNLKGVSQEKGLEGIIVESSDSSIMYKHTVDSIIEDKMEWLRMEVYSRLFGQ